MTRVVTEKTDEIVVKVEDNLDGKVIIHVAKDGVSQQICALATNPSGKLFLQLTRLSERQDFISIVSGDVEIRPSIVS